MKVFIVYQAGYTDKEELEILGVFKSLDSAIKLYSTYIQDNLENYGFVEDVEAKYTDQLIYGCCMTRLFHRLSRKLEQLFRILYS